MEACQSIDYGIGKKSTKEILTKAKRKIIEEIFRNPFTKKTQERNGKEKLIPFSRDMRTVILFPYSEIKVK